MPQDVDRVPPRQLTDNEKVPIKLATSEGHRGRVTNKTSKWYHVVDKVKEAAVDNCTTDAYENMSREEQLNRKNKGYVVGGWFGRGVRKVQNCVHRSMGTFDIDDCTPEQAELILTGEHNKLSQYEYVAYTTRSHSPEHPRLRVLVPFAKPISPEKYIPLARIVAQEIDPDMKMVSRETFNIAQFMYWPTVSKDQEYRTFHNTGKMMDAEDDVLNQFFERDIFGDMETVWNDYSLLPRRPDEKAARQSQKKATDPRTKRGWIGAFCKAYPVTEAMRKFLPDLYAPGTADDESRWTYLPGATLNGAVVYDDDTQLFSNHGTDKVGGKLVNAWDLVRLHRFGELDTEGALERAGDNVAQHPSHLAMLDFVQTSPECEDARRMHTADSYDLDAMADDAEFAADDGDEPYVQPSVGAIGVEAEQQAVDVTTKTSAKKGKAEPEKGKTKRAWTDDLDMTDKGTVKNSLYNLDLILLNDSHFKGRLAYNELTEEAVIVRQIVSKRLGKKSPPIRDKEMGNPIEDDDRALIRTILESPRGENNPGWGLKVSERDLTDALRGVSRKHSFHPIKRYLNACVKTWDGVHRIETMFTKYWNVHPEPYVEEVAMLWMMAGVARVFHPGFKFDCLPIFEGEQDMGKSIAGMMLAGDAYFGEFGVRDMQDTGKVVENMSGKWIMQMPELTQMLRTESEVLKAFFSQQQRRTRVAWARAPKDYYQQCILYGTTNDRSYLSDPTGNRRYWPLAVRGKIDVQGIKRDRDQLWGEAVVKFRAMQDCYNRIGADLILELSPDGKARARVLQGERVVFGQEQMWFETIREWLETPTIPVIYRGGASIHNADVVALGKDIPPDVTPDNWLPIQRTCVADIAGHALRIDTNRPGAWSQNSGKMVARIMDAMPGWTRSGKQVKIGRLNKTTVWVREVTSTKYDDL